MQYNEVKNDDKTVLKIIIVILRVMADVKEIVKSVFANLDQLEALKNALRHEVLHGPLIDENLFHEKIDEVTTVYDNFLAARAELYQRIIPKRGRLVSICWDWIGDNRNSEDPEDDLGVINCMLNFTLDELVRQSKHDFNGYKDYVSGLFISKMGGTQFFKNAQRMAQKHDAIESDTDSSDA